MPAEITMPQLSDTMTEGTVVKWLKKEGDKVSQGEIIAEIETDKATMEMESFESGTLAVIVAGEGQKAQVGKPIAVLAVGKESVEDARKAAPTKSSAPTTTTPTPLAPTTPASTAATPKSSASTSDAVVHAKPAPAPVPAATAAEASSSAADGERIVASPLARRIAAEKGIDLRQVRGSGPGGRIVQADVLAFASAPATTASVAVASSASTPAAASPQLPARLATGQKQVVPLTKMRQTIAVRLQQSKQQVPHFYESIDIDMEAVVTLREKLNKQLEPQKLRLSVSDFVNKAIAVALVQHPALNAHWDDKAQQIIRFGDVHLGIAVSVPDGLIVPVLRSVDQMGLREIRVRSVDLAERARAGKLKREELSGATFTVSTLGAFGIREFSAIINPPEVGILAVGAAEKRAVVVNDHVVARTMMTVTLSVDHRAVDGATAADFLRTLKQLLEEPGMMLS
jgi:pyruvate dehydrogenase E2 component (dihydrolipoamide acetyltransferase)